MKRIFLFLPTILFVSCNQPSQQVQTVTTSAPRNIGQVALKSQDSLQAIINANINKQPAIDTVVFGFVFNTTKKQVTAHFNDLVKKKKIVVNDADGTSEYPMTFDFVKANAKIAPDYNDDKLYKLTLIINPANNVITDKILYLQAATAYSERYKDFTRFKEPDLFEPNEYKFHWIKNNLHIFLHQTEEGTIVSYINLTIEQNIEKKKSIAKDSASAQTKRDI